MAELKNRALSLDPNLVSYWRLEGNSNDSKGSNNGTDTAITYPAGKYGQAAGCNGTTSFIDVGASATLQGSVFTYAAWLYCTGGFSTVIGWSSGNGPQWRIVGTTLQLLKQDIVAIDSAGGDLIGSTWCHGAVSYDASGNYKFYVNGVNTKSGTNLQTFTFANMWIGGRVTNAEFFNGNIDEVAVFNRVLTPTEVAQLYLDRAVSNSRLRPHPFSPGLAR